MTDTTEIFAGGVRGIPKSLLRLEGATALAVASIGYAQTGTSWWLFVGLFLLPDVSMLGYFAGRGAGAALYNAAHSYIAPALLVLAGWYGGMHLVPVALIWAAHIGFDRLMGYGLKYRSGFGDTHLGQVGSARRHGVVAAPISA